MQTQDKPYSCGQCNLSFKINKDIRGGVKYYFADFPPPPLRVFFSGKEEVTDLGGTPPPFTDFPPKIFPQKGLKMVFFAQKTPDFGPKNRLGIWGVPPSPPLRIFFSAKRGLRILRTKSAK